ncbi:hypothetical protein GmHk_13G038712 [Glycine max]|nr:hypothetical protein GmHk_13G038712 [Glycine max]KAH1218279.1 hypothetical protein GmHk_13G038712 [Glycine max]
MGSHFTPCKLPQNSHSIFSGNITEASTGGLLCHDTTRLLPRVHEPRGRKKYPSFFSLYFFHFLNPVPRLRGAPNLFFSFFTLSQFQVGVEGRVRDPFGRGGGF